MSSYAVAYNPTSYMEGEIELGLHNVQEFVLSASGSDGSDSDDGVSRSRKLPKLLAVISAVTVVLATATYAASGRSASKDVVAVRRSLDSEANDNRLTEINQQIKTSQPAQLDVGGGAGDHDKETPRGAHSPVASPTEAAPSPPAPAANVRRAPPATVTSVTPDERMHDGNPCDDSEELFAGLCYAKCAVLTGGAYPTRKSAFTCCAQPDCGINIFKMKTASLLPCSGFDVSSADGGAACPHAAGTCLKDEEMFGGECFEKCSLLTNGNYPNRIAELTCCKSEGIACLDPFNDWTGAQLAVGGGAGDNNDKTPRGAHFPLKRLTEAASPSPTPATNVRRVPSTSVTPEEHMHDGNPCDDSEELFAGLCYSKCAVLTGGAYPTRKSAFTCCAQPDCGLNLFKMKTASLLPCSGFDVSSTGGETACPHAAGTCLKDEELFGGECFEKCSLLTNGTHPNRVAELTCCKSDGIACLDPFNDWTAKSFAVGGGAGDMDARTPQSAHWPLKRLTEAAV